MSDTRPVMAHCQPLAGLQNNHLCLHVETGSENDRSIPRLGVCRFMQVLRNRAASTSSGALPRQPQTTARPCRGSRVVSTPQDGPCGPFVAHACAMRSRTFSMCMQPLSAAEGLRYAQEDQRINVQIETVTIDAPLHTTDHDPGSGLQARHRSVKCRWPPSYTCISAGR